MRTKPGECANCGAPVRTPVINEPWCEPCKDKEEARHQKEDYLGNHRFSRPPKYVLAKAAWASFGYKP